MEKKLSSTSFFKFAVPGLISLVASVAHAATLQTYTISNTYLVPDVATFTYSFDVTINDGCTSCTLADITSTIPANQAMSSSMDVPGSPWVLMSSTTNPFSSNGLSFNTSTNAVTFSLASPAVFNQGGCTGCTTVDTSGSNNFTIEGNTPLSGGLFSTAVTLNPSPVPLPSSALLFGSGLLGLGVMRRKGKARNT